MKNLFYIDRLASDVVDEEAEFIPLLSNEDEEKINKEQFDPTFYQDQTSIKAIDREFSPLLDNPERFTWGIGPYITHRLFNPDLPLSVETGIEFQAGYQLTPRIKLSGALRKSVALKSRLNF